MTWLMPAAAGAFWAGLFAWQWHERLLGEGLGRSSVIAMAISLAISALLAALVAAPRRPAHRAVGVLTVAPVARQGGMTALALFAVGVVALGSAWGGVAQNRLDNALTGHLARSSLGEVTVIGTLRRDPQPGSFGWHSILDARQVRWRDGGVSLREAVWLSVDGDLLRAARGDEIIAQGRLRLPSDEDFAAALNRRGIAAELSASGASRLGSAPAMFVRATQSFRETASRSISRIFPPREAGLLMGLALGDDSDLDPGMRRDFEATGLGHLLVVSGENVAMVLAPIIALTLALRLGRWPRFALCLLTVLFFVVLTGAEPSVMRAGVMATMTLVGVLTGRPRSAGVALGATVLLLLIVDPWLAWSVGFQLSVAATGSMLMLATPLTERLRSSMPHPVAAATGTTLAAQTGVTPLLLFYFHDVPLISIVANVLAFPAISPALLLGIGAAVTGIFIEPAGRLIAALARLPMTYLALVADVMAKAPVGHVTGGGAITLIGGLSLLVVLERWLRGGWRPPRKAALLLALAVPVFFWNGAINAGSPDGLEVRFFDVGQGDAALVSTPEGARILIDGGPEPDFVAMRLAALGVKRLDLVVATHSHADHIVGLPAVLARFHVGSILEPGCPTDSAMQAELDRAISDEKIPVRHPMAGDGVSLGSLRIDVLSPDRCWLGTNSDPNNDSLVLKLTLGASTVLMSNEPEQEAQRVMLDAGTPLEADVINVPHHGSTTSLAEFFPAVGADIAVISVGPNTYGHPAPSTVAAVTAAGSRIWRTDEHGDVVVTFGLTGPVVSTDR